MMNPIALTVNIYHSLSYIPRVLFLGPNSVEAKEAWFLSQWQLTEQPPHIIQ